MKKIIALLGDFYHKEELARESLTSALQERIASKELELHFVKDAVSLSAELKNAPDAVILFAENRLSPIEQPEATWMTAELSNQIVQYVENGGGWLSWHSGLASYPIDSGYTKMVRGYFLSHPAQHQEIVYTAAGDEGLSDSFQFMDEHYFVHCDEDHTEVFIRSSSVDGESIAGWRHPYGAGKVSCLTPAHRMDGLLDSHFLGWLNHEVEWLVDLNNE